MIRKNKILTWAVILLVLLNAATIGTIIIQNYRSKQTTENIGINTGSGVNMLNGRFFREMLGFNEEQMASFRNINQAFRPYAMDLTYEVDSLKNEMFIELQNAVPDTIRLNSMSIKIGELHGKLKYKTYHFYLSIKKICSPVQSTALEKAFQPLFKKEEFTTSPNHQQRKGWNRN